MNKLKYFTLAAAAGICCMITARAVEAQVSVNVGFGVAPACPYGYYDTNPYGCAPYGYYGPEWFAGGVFIGAGPWFHGSEKFQGHVNNRLHPEHGYRGPAPQPGERAEPSHRLDRVAHFNGNEVRDGRGHVGDGRR